MSKNLEKISRNYLKIGKIRECLEIEKIRECLKIGKI